MIKGRIQVFVSFRKKGRLVIHLILYVYPYRVRLDTWFYSAEATAVVQVGGGRAVYFWFVDSPLFVSEYMFVMKLFFPIGAVHRLPPFFWRMTKGFCNCAYLRRVGTGILVGLMSRVFFSLSLQFPPVHSCRSMTCAA